MSGMDWIITTLLGCVGGIGAWFFTNFVAKPVIKFFTLRYEAARIIRNANYGARSEPRI